MVVRRVRNITPNVDNKKGDNSTSFEKSIYSNPYFEMQKQFNRLKGHTSISYLMGEKGIFQIKDNETIFISDPICVLERYKQSEEGTVQVKLMYKVNNTFQTREFPMSILVPKNIEKLIDYGFPIQANNYKALSNFLMQQQYIAPMLRHYTDVGFFEDKECKQLVFGMNEIIKGNDTEGRMPFVFDSENASFDLTPAGNLVEWITMVKDEVIGHTPLEFILACGFSSAIVGYLYQKDYLTDTLMINLTGDSTSGKTTAGMLAVSIFGAPTKKQKGLFTSWNGTSNAILQSLVGNYGVPYLIDELSMSNEGDFSSFLYSIADGRNKKRLNKELSFQNTGGWATTIFSTGELSILSKSANNTGLKLRALEFSNEQWTTSAENSNNIKECVMKNYGHAGKEFVKYILKNPSIIDNLLPLNIKNFTSILTDSPFKERMAKKYAIIQLAAELANKVFNFGIDIDNLKNFIVERDAMLAESRDIGKTAWNRMLEFVQQHQNQFIIGNVPNYSQEIVGKIVGGKPKLKVSILKNVFEKAMHDFGYQDTQTILKNWKKKGWLDYEGGRLTSRKQVFSKEQQDQRQAILGVDDLPKKPADTVYTLLVDAEDLQFSS
ncbi:DUF927 domain-containing protein [Rummeliibacillus sp. TYF-LIM-RU47]|uniref:DUF927 domain-containing protein n=1 Tax=Rummeliibacillus sp. TYF-LIM-RU47 TaxID=2608406 RepID=UPI00123A4829|nr:DUF927 domain-containing protein [Rummeliibacillus sp. TYF-LIM-RU47]